MADSQLNFDVYSHLLTFVSSPSDLLSFGLANKDLFELAGPEIIYRSIRCKLSNNAVWEHLIANSAQASRVRELEIQRENPSGYGPLDERERLPEGKNLDSSGLSSVDYAEVEKSERLLLSAIHKMVNLESFTWDRWVPVVNQGEEVQESREVQPATYSEDIWTALRDHAQIKRLNVVDLGRSEVLLEGIRPIFESTIFTLGNLTHLDLKIIYSPLNENEGAEGVNNHNDDDDDEEELLPGRVRIERLQDLLSRCPNLETLSLAILDRSFYYDFDGNPFTNISSILSSNPLPRLSSLKLQDILIDDDVLAHFIVAHPNLRHFSAFLSIDGDSLPSSPFALEGYEDELIDILPNLLTIDLPPEPLRIILRGLKRPSVIRELSVVEPCDWDAHEDGESEERVSSLDDVWGAPEENLESPMEGTHRSQLKNLLIDMPGLQSIVVKDVVSLSQLDKLSKATPTVESVTFRGPFIGHLANHPRPHAELLPYIARWPRLKSLRGCHLFAGASVDFASTDTLAAAKEIAQACPLVRSVSWHGQSVKLVQADDGEVTLEDKNA
ncbi:unnamed protein product [Cyclocybe aegerita]|uniref:F-box domain-containing protein n=1 Tax=Cyclocybe aegerita TaxID=1973307 RepID=A0A8S0WR36_CYCAE|nr:unnamed protein product [Cyclocybe aegerita]